MPSYTPPTKDMQFILHDMLNVSASGTPGYAELDADFTGAVLEEAGKIARDLLTLIALIIVMIVQDWALTLASLLIGPPVIIAVAYVSRRIRSVVRDTVMLGAHVAGTMQEVSQGITVVKAFTMEDQLKEKIRGLIDRAHWRRVMRIDRVETAIAAGTAIGTVLVSLEVAILGGMLAALITYLYRSARPALRTMGFDRPPGADQGRGGKHKDRQRRHAVKTNDFR